MNFVRSNRSTTKHRRNRMRLARYVAAVLAALSICCLTIGAGPSGKKDLISGQWDATFHAQGQTAEAVLVMKLDGGKVTGSVTSAHTGPGTISKGTWANNKLDLTFDFAKHDSIVVTGTLVNGRLSGEFRTEGFTDKWEATKRP